MSAVILSTFIQTTTCQLHLYRSSFGEQVIVEMTSLSLSVERFFCDVLALPDLCDILLYLLTYCCHQASEAWLESDLFLFISYLLLIKFSATVRVTRLFFSTTTTLPCFCIPFSLVFIILT